MMKLSALAAALSALPAAFAAQSLYGQCGGIGWTGDTTCVSGATCTYLNDYYSQCLPSSSSSSTTTSSTSSSSSTGTTTSTAASGTGSSSVCGSGLTKLKYTGVTESCLEFGDGIWPGQYGKDYTAPSSTSIDYFVSQGFNTFRVPFMMERLSPPSTGLTGAFNTTYLGYIQTIVSYITGKGAYAVLDPHNYMRYNGAVITSTSDFQTWWQKLATVFASNSLVIFDLQNEPYSIDASTVASLMQAGINGVRAAGAKQLILVEGTSWTGAWSWTSSGNSDAFAKGKLTDSANNFAIEMHQYLDSDSSGTNAACVNSTVGADRIAAATTWLQAQGLKGFLGEYGGGSSSTCISAIEGLLCSMQKSGVWIGALWWAAGPWWGSSYFLSMEPTTGPALAVLPYIKSSLSS